MNPVNRRQFLTGVAALPGSLVVAGALPALLSSAEAVAAPPPSPFTLAERNRRWSNIRSMMSKKGYDCLILPHRAGDGINQLMYADYVSGGGFFPFGDGAVVFPLKGEPVLLNAFLPSPWITNRADKAFQDNGVQIPLGERIVEVVQEMGHAKSNIAVVGTKASVEGLNEFMNEGLVTYAVWSAVLAGLPKATFTDITEPFSLIMMVKSAEEIATIEKSAMLGEKLHELLLEKVAIGTTRNEFQARVDHFLALNGARADVKALGMAPGPFLKGHVINTEYGVIHGGGYSQVTLCLSAGPMTGETRKLADVAHQLMELGAAKLRAGTTFGDVIEPMEKLVADAGYWHMFPMIHGLLPMTLVGPTYIAGPNNPGGPCLGAHVEITEGMAFSFEPAARSGKFAEARVGGTAVVTADGLNMINKLGTRVHEV